MLKTLQGSPSKTLIFVMQLKNAYSSSSDRRHRLLSIRTEQKQLYGRIIRDDGKKLRCDNTKAEPDLNNEPTTANKALRVSKPELTSEFYWLVQREINSGNIVIFHHNDCTPQEFE